MHLLQFSFLGVVIYMALGTSSWVNPFPMDSTMLDTLDTLGDSWTWPVILGTVLTIQLIRDLVSHSLILTPVSHGLLVDTLAQVLLTVGNSAMVVNRVVYDGDVFPTHLWTVHMP